ncbi:MAG: hypothetical protein ACP5KN_00335 [Armatimonadota bacterium]
MSRAAMLAAVAVIAAHCAAQQRYPISGEPVIIQAAEARVSPDDVWHGTVTAPEAGAQERLVLHMRARLHVEPGGGCNWALRVLVNDALLDEAVSAPRLLNKPPAFDLLGTEYHFDWYSRQHQAWMALFAPDYAGDLTDAEEDFDCLWEITDFARPGEPLTVAVQYAMKSIPATLGRPAPLVVSDVWVAAMPRDEVERMRREVIGAMADRRQVPIEPRLPADAPEGEVPYELQWSGRPESPEPQVTFEDLSAWTAWVRGDAGVELAASREHTAWRSQGLLVRCEGGEANSILELRPPEPIDLAGEWDAIDLWAYVDCGALHVPRPIMPVAVVEDAEGRRHEIPMGHLRAYYWYVSHAALSARQRERIAFPARFVGLLLDRCNREEPCRVWLESLAFYRQAREPYARSARPAVPIFPTGEDAMLPTPPEGAASQARPANIREFMCRTDEWVLFFFIDFGERGPFGVPCKFETLDRSASIMLMPLDRGGIVFETPAGPVLTGAENCELLERATEGEVLRTRWRFAAEGVEAEFTVDYRIRGATLVLDVRCPGGDAIGTRFGVVSGEAVKTTEVPYLQMGTPPGPLVAHTEDVFVSALYDWPNCDFSVSEVTPEPAAEGGVAINGGSVYERLSDGRRRDLHDRIIVTIAPEFEQVLPNVPNPRAQNLDEAARFMYVMGGGPTPEMWRTMARYGIEHVIAMHFGGMWWRRAGEGFSMRNRPRPEMSVEQMRRYADEVRSLGYRFGVLLEYRDFFPMNEFWDPDLLSLTPGGDWQTSWAGHYATKPIAMAMLARRNGERLEERVPIDAVYMDTHTNQSLTARDYEAGVPGAGSGPAQAQFNGECILAVRDTHDAIVCSEGIYRWLYAGLSDMDYATWPIRSVLPAQRDILPDFDLLKIHPGQIGTGMGYNPRPFFGEDNLGEIYGDPGGPVPPADYYQYLAATIAHGHSAILGYGYFPPLHRMIHYYAMLAGPQREWLTDSVTSIERHDGERFVSTSEAIRREILDIGRIRVSYSRGLVICVNYNREEPWTVEIAGEQYALPPRGWAAVKPGEVEAFSALLDGRRVDYVRCPDYVYLSSGGDPASYGGVTADGALLIHREEDGLRIIPCGNLGSWETGPGEEYPFHYDRRVTGIPDDRGTRELRIDLRRVAPELADAGRVVGRDLAMQPTDASAPLDGGIVHIQPDAETVDYIVSR